MPVSRAQPADEVTYPLGATARLTGLSPELLRAWERRYGAVEPFRTPGGTRRYRASDVERLRLLKAVVDAGHRISQVAVLTDDELERLREDGNGRATLPLDDVFAALESLDAPEVQRLLATRLVALGPARFSREFAVPLVHEIGDRWASDRLDVAAEHLATAALRSLLGAALHPTARSAIGPVVLFATPNGERHELGLLMATLTALGAGANPIYLGPDLPVEELLRAADRSQPAAVALSIVNLPDPHARRTIGAIRGGLPAEIRLWVGGAGAQDLDLPDGVERVDSLEAFEQRVQLLDYELGAR